MKVKKRAVTRTSTPKQYVVISQDKERKVIFEARTVGEGVAFVRGRRSGVLCKVLSDALQ